MEYAATLGVFLGIYLILASSFNLLVGTAGLFSFAHAAFYALGAYVAALTTTQLQQPFLLGLLAAALVSGLAGLALGAISLRLREEYLLVATLGFHLLFVELLLNSQPVTGGAMGLRGIPAPTLLGERLASPGRYLILVAVAAAIALWLVWHLQHSPFGRALRGLREDETAAATLGKPVVRLKIAVFTISAGMAAVAGGLYAHFTRFLDPFAFSLDIAVALFAMVLVGGMGSFWGGLLGAAVILLVPEGLKLVGHSAPWQAPAVQVTYGLLLLGFVFARPSGLIPELRRRDRRTHFPDVSKAVPEGTAPAVPKPSAITSMPLEMDRLVRRFGGTTAVSGASFRADPGVVTALIGPNGAGKTTIFNLISGVQRPDAGEVRLAGRRIDRLPPEAIARCGVARSFQDLRLFTRMTVVENVLVARPAMSGESPLRAALFGPLLRREERTETTRSLYYLEIVGLRDKAQAPASDLSYGQQKLLAIARALATEASVYLFDELASGVAPVILRRVAEVLHQLRAAGATTILVEHNFHFVREVADQVVFLHQGAVRAVGQADALVADAELTAIYFGGGVGSAV